jgi:hypothetical protein
VAQRFPAATLGPAFSITGEWRVSAKKPDELLAPVPVNESLILPDIKTRSDALHVPAVRLLNRRFVIVMLYVLHRINIVAVIDELHSVFRHSRRPSREADWLLCETVGVTQ